MKRTIRTRSRAGFTMIEIAIGSVLLLILGASIVESTSSMKRMALTTSTQGQLQDQARRVMDILLTDLRRSGFVELDGLEFPHFFESAPADEYDAQEHAHAAPVKAAVDGDIDFGGDREILFVLPSDIDGNNDPDVNPVTGALMWDADNMISYSIITGQDGRNSLIRRETDGAVRIVARDVERFFIEDFSVDPSLLPSTVRVNVFFRSTDADGHEYRYRVQSWVSLRNGTNI